MTPCIPRLAISLSFARAAPASGVPESIANWNLFLKNSIFLTSSKASASLAAMTAGVRRSLATLEAMTFLFRPAAADLTLVGNHLRMCEKWTSWARTAFLAVFWFGSSAGPFCYGSQDEVESNELCVQFLCPDGHSDERDEAANCPEHALVVGGGG